MRDGTYTEIQLQANREARSWAAETIRRHLRRHPTEEAIEAFLDYVDYSWSEAIAAAYNAMRNAPIWDGGQPSVAAYRSDHRIARSLKARDRCAVCGMPIYRLRNGSWRHDPGRWLYM